MTPLTLIEFMALVNTAIKVGSKVAVEVLDLINRIKAGEEPTREEVVNVLQKIDADEVLTHSLLKNPISLTPNPASN